MTQINNKTLIELLNDTLEEVREIKRLLRKKKPRIRVTGVYGPKKKRTIRSEKGGTA